MIGDRDPSRAWKHPAGWPRLVAAGDRDRQHRDSQRRRETEGAELESLHAPGERSFPLGEDHDDVARLEQTDRLAHRRRIGRLHPDRKGPEPPDHPAEHRDLEEPAPGHVVDASADRDRHERRVGISLVVRRDDEGPVGGNVVGARQLENEVGTAEAAKSRASEIDDGGWPGYAGGWGLARRFARGGLAWISSPRRENGEWPPIPRVTSPRATAPPI